MHRQPQHHSRQHDPSMRDRPQQRHNHDAQKPLGAPPRTNRRDHRVQQPNTRDLQTPLHLHPPSSSGGAPQDQHHQPSGHDVRNAEDHFAEREPCGAAGGRGRGRGPGGREEEPREERCVAVRFALVRGETTGDVAGGVGEDEVVDVGIF